MKSIAALFPVVCRGIQLLRAKALADGLEKLEANQVNIARFLLSPDPSLDRRHTGRHKGGRRYGRGWDRERDNFIDRKGTGAGDKRP
jgi:hypothetical protein